MARFGVTYQDIANAADNLIGQGKQPTIELIRQLLGTGSTTTIANHLRKWRAEQDGSTSVAIKENLPQEFVSVMKGLWQRLQAHADNQIAVVKQDLEQRIVREQQEVEKYKTNNQRWQKMYDAWAKEKDELVRDKLGLEQGINLLKSDNAGLTATINSQQERIDELNRLHKLAQENLEHYRESARIQRLMDQEKFSQQIQQLEMNIKNAEQKMISLNQEKISVEVKHEQLNNNYTQLQNTFDELNQSTLKLQSQLEQVKVELHDQKRDAINYKSQLDDLQNKFNQQSNKLIESEKQNAILDQRLEAAINEVQELKEQAKFLAREKWEIAQEKAQLEGQMRQFNIAIA